jgi:putative peptidoglycan lipid II flippase
VTAAGAGTGADATGVTRAAAGMGVATAASRFIGFARILVIAAVLGTTFLGNAYQSSNAVSNVLFELLAAGALSAVLVPTFVELLDRDDQPEAERLAGRLLGVALVVLGVVAIIGILAAPLIADLLTTGVSDPKIAEQQRDLSTFLLRFTVPQILLYAIGAVSVAVLYAKRKLAVTAMAPIGLTVVVVVAMGLFRVVAGPDPGLELSTGERLILALGATLGVAAFVGIPTIALHRTGFRLRPRLARHHDEAVREVLGRSGWAVFQHSMIGMLLLAAIIVGNTVEGGTLAYQVAWVFFLAPYAVLAQPIHTAILPDLTRQAKDPDHFASSLRWALDSMAVLIVPVAGMLVALALPIMQVAAFGQATKAGGVGLLAMALATLAIGLYTYSAFLLFARAYYALGDSRTPALVAILSAVAGIGVMVAGGVLTSGRTTVAFLGLGHSVAYAVGALVLWIGLARRTGHLIVPASLGRSIAVTAPLAVGAWALVRVIDPAGRLATALLVVGIVLVGGVIYVAALRAIGGAPSLHPKPPSAPSAVDVPPYGAPA